MNVTELASPKNNQNSYSGFSELNRRIGIAEHAKHETEVAQYMTTPESSMRKAGFYFIRIAIAATITASTLLIIANK